MATATSTATATATVTAMVTACGGVGDNNNGSDGDGGGEGDDDGDSDDGDCGGGDNNGATTATTTVEAVAAAGSGRGRAKAADRGGGGGAYEMQELPPLHGAPQRRTYGRHFQEFPCMRTQALLALCTLARIQFPGNNNPGDAGRFARTEVGWVVAPHPFVLCVVEWEGCRHQTQPGPTRA